MRDRAWAKRILDGDRVAGERLVADNYAPIYRMLRGLTGDADTAEDLTQQAFTRAWQALAGYRGEASLATWLARIAYHEYTHWRRDRRPCLPLDDIAALPDRRASHSLKTMLLERALADLPDDLRETFTLFYVQELSVGEAAVVLDVPAGTVKSRLFSARRRLRELLADSLEESSPPNAAPLPVPRTRKEVGSHDLPANIAP